MARPAAGTVVRRATKRGISYYLRVTWRDPATGQHRALPRAARRRVGGLGPRSASQEERELIAKLIARGEWVPPQRARAPRPRRVHRTRRARPRPSRSPPARHYDRRQRRMGSDKSRAGPALAPRPSPSAISARSRSTRSPPATSTTWSTPAARARRHQARPPPQGAAPLMEDYVDARTGRTHQRRRRGLANSSINKVVRAVRAVLDDAVRHRVVDRNAADDPDTLVREDRPQRSFLEPFQVAALLDAGAALERERRRAELGRRARHPRQQRVERRAGAPLPRLATGSSPRSAAARCGSPSPCATATTSPGPSSSRRSCSRGCASASSARWMARTSTSPGRRIYVPAPAQRPATAASSACRGSRPRPPSASSRCCPPLYDLLLDHKAEFGYGPHRTRCSPPATAGATPSTTCAARSSTHLSERANELLAARGQRQIARCTPHTLRRTFASILAEINLPPAAGDVPPRAHQTRPSRCASTSRSSTWATAASRRSRRSSDAPSTRPSHCFPAGGFCQPIVNRPKKTPPSPVTWSELEGAETARSAGLLRSG